MTKILFVSDIHIGIRYSYRINIRTGISERTLDFIKAFRRVVDYAINNKIDIFVISGDLYERVTIGPTILRKVREVVWKPLIESKIPIIVVGGNHDTPQIREKGSPLGEISLFPNSVVARKPEIHKVKSLNSDEVVGFILIPYMTATQAVEYVEKILGKEIDREQQMVRSQEMFKEWISTAVKGLNTDVKIIVGHFYVQGSKIGVIPYPDQLPHEFKFNKEMLSLDDIDLAVFGHIHTPQSLYGNKLLVPGSLERVDFGEISEDKGFYIYDTQSKNLQFISNTPRSLIKTRIEVPNDIENPTEYILDRFPHEVEDSIVRIEIRINEILKTRVIIPYLHKALEGKTFHFEFIWNTYERYDEIILSDVVLNPLVLFNEYITKKFENYQYQNELREKGYEILDRALSKVDEEQ